MLTESSRTDVPSLACAAGSATAGTNSAATRTEGATPGAARLAAKPWRLRVVDPRSIVLYVVITNVILSGTGSEALLFTTLGIIAATVALMAPPRVSLGWGGFVVFWVLCYAVLPYVWHSKVAAALAFIAFWMFRFAGLFGALIAAGCALDIQRVGAVLTQLRAPHVLYVPIMVVIRFFPMAMGELRAIIQAMTLRGLKPGVGQAMLHPLRTGEYVVIPFLGSAARIADELSAAAIIKGLGSEGARETAWTSRFGVGDAVVVATMVVLVAWRIGEVVA